PGNALGDLQAINDHEFLIIERDGAQGPAAALKKVFKIDLSQTHSDGFVRKVEVLDLLDIADPIGISTSTPLPRPGDFGLGDPFRFPFVTIEDVVILSPTDLLVINDKHFPFSAGRNPSLPDDNEFIRVLLDDALGVDPEVLVRPALLSAREELLAAAHAALTGAFDDAGGSGALALAAMKRARDLFRLHAPERLEKRLRHLIEARKLTKVALAKVELGRSEQAAAGFIAARDLIGQALPRVKT
ncbi:MAG: esterase-like activity of phytase family protein, partial [Gammaproteobacteria bacterium]